MLVGIFLPPQVNFNLCYTDHGLTCFRGTIQGQAIVKMDQGAALLRCLYLYSYSRGGTMNSKNLLTVTAVILALVAVS